MPLLERGHEVRRLACVTLKLWMYHETTCSCQAAWDKNGGSASRRAGVFTPSSKFNARGILFLRRMIEEFSSTVLTPFAMSN